MPTSKKPAEAKAPGVLIDKQTSLLLARGSDGTKSQGKVSSDAAAASDIMHTYSHKNGTNRGTTGYGGQRNATTSGYPSCHYQDTYCEEDVESLLSDWMELDSQFSVDSEDDSDGGNSNNNTAGGANSREGGKKKKKKRFMRKLQWRPPGNPKKINPKDKNVPRLPPSTSPLSAHLSGRVKNVKNGALNKHTTSGTNSSKQYMSKSSSDAATVVSHRTAYTHASGATQKHSNRAGGHNGRSGGGSSFERGVGGGASVSAASVKSTTPPLLRYRKELLKRQQEQQEGSAHNSMNGRRIMQSNQSGNAILESDEDAVAEGGNGENIVQETDEIVLFGSAFKVATNADAVASDGILNTPSKTSAGSAKNGGSPTSVAQFDVVNNEVANTNDGVAPPPPARQTSSSSPTFEKKGVTLSTKKSDESDLGNNEKDDTYRSAMDKMRRLMVNPSSGTNAKAAQDESGEQQVKFDPNNTSTDTSIFGDSANTIKNNNDGNNPDDSTIEDSSKRASGPIDVDTCTRHLTPTELRNLCAMHKLGYAHLRRNEISSALSVFTEILRGQGERHGRKSLEVAMAMHNLGVVCVKGERYEEACRLCDGAARIRVEKLGKDHLDVAVSLAQQGVALMEIQEYPLALASFREALRIRRLAFGEKHPLVVRLLNNIGCALFEMEELRDSKVAFEEALSVQRYLMRENNAGGGDEEDEFEANFQSKKTEGVDAKGAHNMLLSIALTLRNLGSIHFRWGEYDESLVFYEEALLVSCRLLSCTSLGNIDLCPSCSHYIFRYCALDPRVCFRRRSQTCR